MWLKASLHTDAQRASEPKRARWNPTPAGLYRHQSGTACEELGAPKGTLPTLTKL